MGTNRPGAKPWMILPLALACLGAPRATASPVIYHLDQRFATIQFSVAGPGMIGAEGSFSHFTANLRLDLKDPATSTIAVSVDDAAIDMAWPDAVAMLRSPAYFDVQAFPAITFRSVSVTRLAATHFIIHGMLTIRGITRPQEMDAVLVTMQKAGPQNSTATPTIAHFVVTGGLHRSDFGMVSDRSMISDAIALKITARIVLAPAGAPS
jgi:polyisoprenoid-binding protein YceI